MGNAGRKLIEGATEALAIAKGEIPAAGLFVDGHHYVPRPVWRPISEAPRDGTHIIGLSSRDGDVSRISWGRNYYGDLKLMSEFDKLIGKLDQLVIVSRGMASVAREEGRATRTAMTLGYFALALLIIGAAYFLASH